MAINIKTKAATATVTETHKKKKEVLAEKTTTEPVELPDQLTEAYVDANQATGAAMQVGEAINLDPYCEVGFGASYTHNLGNFESCKVEVSIKIPCKHGEIDEAFDYGKSWVDARLTATNKEISGS